MDQSVCGYFTEYAKLWFAIVIPIYRLGTMEIHRNISVETTNVNFTLAQAEKVRGSPKSVVCILWGTGMS